MSNINESNHDLVEITTDYSISLGSYEQMFRSECLTDVMINCRDGHIKAHKLVLSVWSQYFRDTFMSNVTHHCNQSVIFMRDIPIDHMRILIELMYCGKASVNKHQLTDIRLSAESLQINNSLLQFIRDVRQTPEHSIDSNRRTYKRRRNDANDQPINTDVNQNKENELITNNDEMIADENEANEHRINDQCVDIKQELIEDENKTDDNCEETDHSSSTVKLSDNKSNNKDNVQSSSNQSNQSNEDTNNNNISAKVVNLSQSSDVCNITATDSTVKTKNKKSINKNTEKTHQIRYSSRILSKEKNSKNDNSASQSKSTDGQTSRFSQLSYQERQHHMKLQQIRYQTLKGTQIKTEPLSDDEKSNDSHSNSEKLLVQLNPKDLLALCDSEESEYDFEGNDSAKKSETTPHTSGSNLVETKSNKEQAQQYPTTSSSLGTRLLINNNSLSNLLQSNVVSEPLILYNLVSSSNWNANPLSAPSSIMYFPDSKSAQNKDSISASDQKLVPMWTNFASETGSKAMSQQTPHKTTKTNTPMIPETSQQKKLSHEKDNKTVAKTVNSLLVRKKRNSCYQCNKCVKAYSSHQTLIDHIKIVHENSSENYACKICGKIVKWKDSLRGHFKTNHPDKDSTNMIEILK